MTQQSDEQQVPSQGDDSQPKSYDLEPVAPSAPAPPVSPPPAPAPAAHVPPVPIVSDPFIKPGFGSAQVIGIAGATVLTIAAVFAAVQAGKAGWWSHGLLTMYLGLLHAGTGAAAVGFVAYALGREIGDIPLAAARMLLANALLLLVISVGIPWHPLLVYLSGLGAYGLATLILFRLPMAEWSGIVSIHAILWFLMYLAAKLQVAVSSVPIKAAAT
ncbi:MAG: hypothetical protein U0573_11225 [Phycisphaerales bacterium]|nr:hypothetical protein [Planctomycetota bacterium]